MTNLEIILAVISFFLVLIIIGVIRSIWLSGKRHEEEYKTLLYSGNEFLSNESLGNLTKAAESAKEFLKLYSYIDVMYWDGITKSFDEYSWPDNGLFVLSNCKGLTITVWRVIE